MEWPHEARITKSLDGLLGDQKVSGHLVVHERPRWAVPMALLALAMVIVITISVEALRPLASVLVLLAILAPLNLTGRRWILARSGSSVLLAESPMWFPKATRIVAVDQAPMRPAASGGVLVKWYALFDRRFVVPWISKDKLLRIIG